MKTKNLLRKKILIEEWGKEYKQVRSYSTSNNRLSAPENIIVKLFI